MLGSTKRDFLGIYHVLPSKYEYRQNICIMAELNLTCLRPKESNLVVHLSSYVQVVQKCTCGSALGIQHDTTLWTRTSPYIVLT